MNRTEELRRFVTEAKRGIEIGPYTDPIVPKRLGFNSLSLDVFDFETLKRRAAQDPNLGAAAADLVEPPDLIGPASQIESLFKARFPNERLDYIISSHSLEHLPDPIRFLQGCQEILSPGGVLSLAVPDHRCCFDFFRPLTTLADWLEAFFEQRRTPTPRQRFEFNSLYCLKQGSETWPIEDLCTGDLPQFSNDLVHLYREWVRDNQAPEPEFYHDIHCGVFTPASLRLLLESVIDLSLSEFTILEVSDTVSNEFFVHLLKADRPEHIATEIRSDNRTILAWQMIREAATVATDTASASARAAGISRTRQPSIAAIIPLYNGEQWIGECLASVFAQTRPADEVIVVDDGSTDGSLERVREFAQSHRLTVLHKENEGQSAARNYGVAHATADLVAFLDQDDVWYPPHLERLEREYRNHRGSSFGWVYSNLDRISSEGLLVSRSFLNELGSAHPKRDVTSCLLQDMFILPSASLISRAAFEAVGGFDPRLSGYEDDDFFLRMFQAGYDGHYVDECLSQWRIHGASSSYSFRMARSRRVYAQKLIAAFPDNPRLNLHYVSDVIAPRFVGRAFADVVAALRDGNLVDFPEFISELRELTPRLRPHQRLVWKVALTFLAHYWIASSARNAARMLYLSYKFLKSPLRTTFAYPVARR